VLFEETPEILADKRPARDVWNKIGKGKNHSSVLTFNERYDVMQYYRR
jgi:hypothetical protein